MNWEPVVVLGSSGPTRVNQSAEDDTVVLNPAGFTASIAPSRRTGSSLYVSPNASKWEHHVKIYKVKKDQGGKYYDYINDKLNNNYVPKGMWYGICSCGERAQYWAYGATYGHMVHHQWKEMINANA
jgi:hypothetical protein